MRDPEFIELKNKFFIGMGIVILFAIPIMIFLIKTYGNSNVLNKINKKDSFTILVVSKDCDNCSMVNSALKKNDVKYVKLNSSTNKNYEEIMKKLTIENKSNEFPFIVYVDEGIMKANLFSIESEKDVAEFVEYHGLNNSK
ncbi:MAG: hypothetical protein IJA30_03250 [Bacilli bacterium]|nr:hypothetical protein [Bacilli bacterium]